MHIAQFRDARGLSRSRGWSRGSQQHVVESSNPSRSTSHLVEITKFFAASTNAERCGQMRVSRHKPDTPNLALFQRAPPERAMSKDTGYQQAMAEARATSADP